MAIHLYKTSTPNTGNRAVDSQVKSNPRNNLIYGQRRCGKGHNAREIITARHRGGANKRLYRKIDFRRNEKDIYGRIVTIEYDPNRNAYICLIHYGDGKKRYFYIPEGFFIGINPTIIIMQFILEEFILFITEEFFCCKKRKIHFLS